MVLMRNWSPEQGEDAVAGGLHDIAVVSMDRVNHPLRRRIDNRTGLPGVEVFHQLHRALNVREQRRDCLALAFDSFSRVPLMHGGTRLRGGRRASTCLDGRAYRTGALSTEARIKRGFQTALLGSGAQWRGALLSTL